MSLRLLACAGVALAGCAQLFGIDQTSGPKGGASLTVERVSIGSTVQTGPQDLTNQTATFFLPDPKNPMVLVPTPGALAGNVWSADKLQGTPLVQFSLPDLPQPMQHLWELPAQDLQAAFVAYEHPNPQPAPAASQLTVNVNLPNAYAGTETFEVQAIGAWTHHILGGAELPAVAGTAIGATIPYSAFSAMTASPAYRISASDTVLLLRYQGAQLTGVYQNPTPFDQTDGTDTVSGTMLGVTADKTMTATIDPTTLANRFSAVRPATTGLLGAWSITAAPGASAGSTLGTQLDAGGIAMTDTMVTASFGNPFESLGWPGLASLLVEESRTFMVMTNQLVLHSSMTQVGDAAALTTADFGAPMPEQVNVDDNQLVTDGATVTLDLTVPHVIAMLTENKPATLYTLTLTDVTADATGMMMPTVVLQAASTKPTFTIPPGILQAQHTYVPAVGTITGGYPNAMSGDLETRSLPQSSASFDGGVFTVVSQ